MRICLLADGYPSKENPTFVFVQQLVEALVDDNIQVDVIAPQSITKNLVRQMPFQPFCSEGRTTKGKKYQIFRPKFISFGNCKFLDPLTNLTKDRGIKRAITAIGKDYIDVLYGHFWHNAYALKKIAQRLNRPLFVACGEGDNALEELVASLSQQELDELKETVTGVISVSSENRRKCIKLGLCNETNIVVFPNCVDQTIFHERNRQNCREKLGFNESDFVVIFVGGFIKRKGSSRLSQALREINDKSIKAIFIGKPMGGDIALPSYDQIFFQGPVNHDSLPDYLCAADVFVLPTLKEGCCNSIVESLSCGIPVISSNGAFNDDILDEGCSIRVDPLSVEQIKDAILKLKNNFKLKEQMHFKALEKSKDWSIVSRANNIMVFINSMIEKELKSSK